MNSMFTNQWCPFWLSFLVLFFWYFLWLLLLYVNGYLHWYYRVIVTNMSEILHFTGEKKSRQGTIQPSHSRFSHSCQRWSFYLSSFFLYVFYCGNVKNVFWGKRETLSCPADFFTARHYAKRGICCRRVSVDPSVCVSVTRGVNRLSIIRNSIEKNDYRLWMTIIDNWNLPWQRGDHLKQTTLSRLVQNRADDVIYVL